MYIEYTALPMRIDGVSSSESKHHERLFPARHHSVKHLPI